MRGKKVVIDFSENTSSTSFTPGLDLQEIVSRHSPFVELRGTWRRHNPAAPATVLRTGQKKDQSVHSVSLVSLPVQGRSASPEQ